MTKSIYKYYLNEFLGSARVAGWLTQYDRLLRYEYICLKPDPCNSCDQNNVNESGGWKLDKIIDTGYIEEWDKSHWEEVIQ